MDHPKQIFLDDMGSVRNSLTTSGIISEQSDRPSQMTSGLRVLLCAAPSLSVPPAVKGTADRQQTSQESAGERKGRDGRGDGMLPWQSSQPGEEA